MKKLFFILLAITWYAPAFAQGFVVKTNKVSLDFNKPPINTSVPVIFWLYPSMESSLSREKKIGIEVEIKSDVPIKSIVLSSIVNGEKKTKEITLASNEFTKRISQSMFLVDGENIFEVRVENDKGGAVSESRSILVGDAAITEAVDINRKDYALIFATDKYDEWNDLVNPINDAVTLKNELESKFGFQTEVVQNATYQQVMEKLFDYNARKFNPQDQLFIFFAGHGFFDETLGEGYVVASNSLENDKGKTTYIPHTVLRQRVDNIKCNHIFLAMDVCFGGTFDPMLARRRGDNVYKDATENEFLIRKLSKRTRKFLTSGSKEYVSDGLVGKHSPFAAKFIQALRESGQKEKRLLSLTELETYFLLLPTEPRYGSFGTDEAGSDFVFIHK